MSDNTYFEKQRDLLIQEIGLSMESVIFHLDTLNRSLAGSIAVGKEFEDVARLWSHFYDGATQPKEGTTEKEQRDDATTNSAGSDKEEMDSDVHESSSDTSATRNVNHEV